MGLLIAIGSLGIAVTVVYAWVWALARSAAIGDRLELVKPDRQRISEGDSRDSDQRVGPKDRRVAERPWAGAGQGRRAEDSLRQELAEAQNALRDAETRLAKIERRESA